jgi:hypothetical protein
MSDPASFQRKQDQCPRAKMLPDHRTLAEASALRTLTMASAWPNRSGGAFELRRSIICGTPPSPGNVFFLSPANVAV